jgi:hypothetical protein
MPENEEIEEGWVVVCVGCLRIKRDGVWTNERAEDLAGKSSGYCDWCAKEQRKKQSMPR